MRRHTLIATALGLGLASLAPACGSGASSKPICSGSTPASLTVENFQAWCSVSIAGKAASSAPTQTVCVPDGAVTVAATALPGFELGPAPWHGTTGDAGSGDPGTVTGTGQAATSTTTVSVSGTSGCAWVCCPFTNGTGCPTTTQCMSPPPPSPY